VEREQAEGLLRDDMTPVQIADFVSLVANGLAVAVGSGEPRDLDATLEFVRTALRGSGA
jgi:hypothetical protein